MCRPNEGNLRGLARSRCADNRINFNCTEAGNVADTGLTKFMSMLATLLACNKFVENILSALMLLKPSYSGSSYSTRKVFSSVVFRGCELCAKGYKR